MGNRRPSLPKMLAKILANTCERHIRHALPTHT